MLGDQGTHSEFIHTSSMATNANQETQNKSTRASAPELSVEPIQPAVSTSSVRLKKRSTPRPEPLPPSPADSARPDEDAVDDDNHSDSNLLAQQHNIQVVVRVRPFSKSEIASGESRPFGGCTSRCFSLNCL